MLEDSLRSIRGVYYNLPERAQALIGTLYSSIPASIRLGSEYGKFQKLLENSGDWSKDELENYQFTELKKTILVAHKKIKFYQKRFSEYGVSPDDLQSLADIKKFPTMTKKDIKDNYADLINPDFRASSHLVTTTGGSTAEPARFLHVKGITRSKEKAFIENGWAREGYFPRARTVQLKGRSVGDPEKKIFWQYEAIQNYLEMDSNYLTLDNIDYYLDAIIDFKPLFMIGYASSIYLLAKHMNDKAIPAPKLRCVYLASENVYDWQRDYLKAFFGCRVFSHYGHSEMLLLGMECEHSHNLHFYPQYGLMEVLDAENQPVLPESGKVGELIGTSFHNPLMPLIRYRTQDLGRWAAQDCPCGRQYPILEEVEGRLQEFIVTKDNRLISICVMGAAHFDTLDYVYETQYFQEKLGEVIFKVVPKNGFNDIHAEMLKKAIQEKTGPDVHVTVEKVAAIKKTKNGKHLMIDQKVSLDVLSGPQDLILKDDTL